MKEKKNRHDRSQLLASFRMEAENSLYRCFVRTFLILSVRKNYHRIFQCRIYEYQKRLRYARCGQQSKRMKIPGVTNRSIDYSVIFSNDC